MSYNFVATPKSSPESVVNFNKDVSCVTGDHSDLEEMESMLEAETSDFASGSGMLCFKTCDGANTKL